MYLLVRLVLLISRDSATGLDKDLLDSTIRFSFCYDTTKEELDYAIEALKELLPVLRKYTRH